MTRTVVKTATYSAMHMVVAIAVAWSISGDWRVALGIGLIEPLVQTVAYTIHERLWSRDARARRHARRPADRHTGRHRHGPIGAPTAP